MQKFIKKLINPDSTLIDPNRVFQFESSYFQCSLLQNRIIFIHTLVRHGHFENEKETATNQNGWQKEKGMEMDQMY